MARRKKKPSAGSAPPVILIRLSRDELDVLIQVAHYYERSMGFMRHLVRLSSGPETRRRFRFVAEESHWLLRFAETARDQLIAGGDRERAVPVTVPALVAFWGRLLAGLHSRRTRRKLSEAQIAQREQLAEKLGAIAAEQWDRQPAPVEAAIETRRPVEREWMRVRLSGGKEEALRDPPIERTEPTAAADGESPAR